MGQNEKRRLIFLTACVAVVVLYGLSAGNVTETAVGKDRRRLCRHPADKMRRDRWTIKDRYGCIWEN